MNIRIWLVLVLSICVEARDLLTIRSAGKSFISTKSDIREDGFLEILSDLMSEPNSRRQNIQIKNRETADQILPFSPFEQCELIGYEFNKGEECNEVFEVECGPVNVTKTKFELVNKCKTSIEQKCGVSNTEVPRQQCLERIINR